MILLRIVGASNDPHILGTLVPVEEPFTASGADVAVFGILLPALRDLAAASLSRSDRERSLH
jgi:hypothetical protein